MRSPSHASSSRPSTDGLGRLELLARRRLVEVLEVVEVVEVERHHSVVDLRDALRRHVAAAPERSTAHGEPVEDVRTAVADDVLDLAELVAGWVDDAPAALDDEPGDGI